MWRTDTKPEGFTYSKEFRSEQSAINYFLCNIEEFKRLNEQLITWASSEYIWFDTSDELIYIYKRTNDVYRCNKSKGLKYDFSPGIKT